MIWKLGGHKNMQVAPILDTNNKTNMRPTCDPNNTEIYMGNEVYASYTD